MSALASVEFWITTLIIVASPGTGAIYTIATGLGRGAKASVIAAFASTLGIIPHIAAALLGLAAVLHASAVLFDALKYLGALYLLWMAWQVLRDRGALALQADAAPRSWYLVLRDGIALNLLNPKLSIFFVAFLPQFADPGAAQPLNDMLILSSAFMLVTFVVFVLYGVSAAAMRDRVLFQPRVLAWLRRSFAAAFAALAAKLAVADR